MIQSETISELAKAIISAQGAFEAVEKTSDNPFYSSKYAALPDVVKAASPILKENGLAVVQTLGDDTLTTILLHTSGEYIGDTSTMHLTKIDSQGVGSAVTYHRRYGYMAILGLVADVDDDGNAASPQDRVQTTHREAPQIPNRPTFIPEGVTYLAVSFEDKDRAKALGARFDAQKKAWYVPEGKDPYPFIEWIENDDPETMHF